MNYLHIIATMDPRAGGPCQGIRNLTPRTMDHGHTVEVVCLDDPQAEYLVQPAAHSAAPSAGNGVSPTSALRPPPSDLRPPTPDLRSPTPDLRPPTSDLRSSGPQTAPSSPLAATCSLKIHALGKGRGSWSYHPALRPWLEANLHRFDAVILNGLWQYPGYIMARLAKRPDAPPYFVFPHGMLDPWFQRAPERRFKAIRNWFYWKLVEQHIVRRAAAIFFTCAEEMRLARDTFRPYQPQREINVGYGVGSPPEQHADMPAAFAEKCPGLNDRPYFLFLSRIHPKKGVDLLIKAYAEAYGKPTVSSQRSEVRSQTSDLRSPTSDLRPPTSDLRPPTPDLRPPTSDLRSAPPALVIAGPGLDTPYGKQMQKLASDLCSPSSAPSSPTSDLRPPTSGLVVRSPVVSGQTPAPSSSLPAPGSPTSDLHLGRDGRAAPSAPSPGGEGRGEDGQPNQFPPSAVRPPTSESSPSPRWGEGRGEVSPTSDLRSPTSGLASTLHPPSSAPQPANSQLSTLNHQPAIFFPGMLTGDAKWGALYHAEAFVLTSHQENFGIAVAESLACGKPVLISNQINICQEIEADQAGLVSDDTFAGAVQLFRRWESMSTNERIMMARAAKASYENRFGITRVAESLMATMGNLVAERKAESKN